MIKITAFILSLCTALSVPLQTFAAPGPGGHGGPRPEAFVRDDRPSPGHRVSILPDIATALLISGLTYYVVNGIYYQKQGNQYIVVDAPRETAAALNVVDFNGKRYYVRDGHYYQRDINGEYTEVPRPAGL